MPCDSTLTQGQTEAQRRAEIDASLKALERTLLSGVSRLVVGPGGAVAFAGSWATGSERRGVSDVCAYRTLSARGSWALRQAQASAEMAAGRAVDQAKVAAGVHSHDGGGTWHHGH